MKEFTQTTLYPRGNCWQYAVACLLDVDPDTLPAQFDHYQQADGDGGRWSLWYRNALGAYLKKHHGLAYAEVQAPAAVFERMSPRGLHTMIGLTVRSAAQDGCHHVVVARDGEMIWDPHPSRAGLIGDIRWGFLIPFPAIWERQWRDEPCVCPSCKAVAP